jgi:hypothetical protein
MTQCTFTLIASVQFIIIYICCLQVVHIQGTIFFQLIYLSLSCLISACPNLVKNLLCDYGLHTSIPRSEHNLQSALLSQFKLESFPFISLPLVLKDCKCWRVLHNYNLVQSQSCNVYAVERTSVCVELHIEH